MPTARSSPAVRPAFDPTFAAALEQLGVRVATVASRARAEAIDAVAAHVESALVTLRIAAAMLPPAGPAGAGGSDEPLAIWGDRVGLRHVAGPVWMRTSLDDGLVRDVPDADVSPPPRRGPDLGAAIVRSDVAMTVASGPIGAALLADALGRWSWVSGMARTTWSCTPAAARALVAALDAGAPPVALGPSMAGRLDAAALSVMAGLGWTPQTRQGRGAAPAG